MCFNFFGLREFLNSILWEHSK
ncbi:hypothetical protein WCLP8_2100012 [uncultured Gammaproteobacteria bacterium]